jgi:hypothetical protein
MQNVEAAKAAVRLDRSQLLGFDQTSSTRGEAASERQFCGREVKLGGKAGAKVGVKPTNQSG